MESKGRFLRVVCARCGNHQIIYGKASTRVKCLKCNKLLAKNGGGKTRVMSLIKEVL